LNIDPRLGFAYDLFADHKTSIRGSFTQQHTPFFLGNWSSVLNNAPPWQRSVLQAINTPVTFPSSLPLLEYSPSQLLPTAGPGWNYYNDKVPYFLAYNLNIQRELYGAVLSVGYVGSAGFHLETNQDMNPLTYTLDASGVYHFGSLQTVGGKPTIVANPRINPNLAQFPDAVTSANSPYDSIPVADAFSRYNSLQVTVNRRFKNYFQAQGAYTFSHCTDDGGLYLGPLNPTGAAYYENPYQPRFDTGLCNTDIRQTLRINGLVGLPFHGNRFVEGWQLAGIWAMQGGIPFSVTDGYDVTCNSTCNPRPNVVPGCDLNTHTSAQWFNPACFSLQAVGTLGDEGRNTLIGPNLRQLDMSVTKNTNINERYHIQFRGEIFNILNRANFGLPTFTLYSQGAVAGTGVLNQTAGQIISTVPSSTPRQIQLGMKLLF